MEFSGLSRGALQQAMLNRLGAVADLEKRTRRSRKDLYAAQKELRQIHKELREIEEQLERIVSFPTATATTNNVVEMPRREKKRA